MLMQPDGMIEIKVGDMVSCGQPGQVLKLGYDLRVSSYFTLEDREVTDGHPFWWVSLGGLYGPQFRVQEEFVVQAVADVWNAPVEKVKVVS